MPWLSLFRFAGRGLIGHRLRSALSVLGIAIGIASVTLLTAMGSGVRVYMVDLFMQFGTNILQINPGKVKTMGVPGLLGGSQHHLTIEDAVSLYKVPGITNVVPLSFGTAEVRHDNKGRSVYIYGVNWELPAVWGFQIGQGSFLPRVDDTRQQSVAVLGPTLKRELFGSANALGEHVRVGGQRFRVIGIMAPKGNMMGIDMDDAAYLSAATAMRLFNQPELMEIDVLFQKELDGELIAERVRQHLKHRHRGEEDVTVTTQTGMMDSLDRILTIVAGAVTAIGAVSLLVGAIGILSIMWVSVNERVSEIGLLKALGASSAQIRTIFFTEAALLSVAGGCLGLGFGLGLAGILKLAIPGLPISVPYPFVAGALGLCVVIGVVSGVIPAARAAELDPIEALRAE